METVDRPIESFRQGETARFERVISEKDVRDFAALSGDVNPLHLDEAVAERSRFGHRIAQGLLVTAPFSALAGNLLPGRRCLLLEVHSRFRKPAFPGDRLRYAATVTQVSAGVGVMKVAVEVTDDAGDVICEGGYTAQVLMPSDG